MWKSSHPNTNTHAHNLKCNAYTLRTHTCTHTHTHKTNTYKNTQRQTQIQRKHTTHTYLHARTNARTQARRHARFICVDSGMQPEKVGRHQNPSRKRPSSGIAVKWALYFKRYVKIFNKIATQSYTIHMGSGQRSH